MALTYHNIIGTYVDYINTISTVK